MARPMRPPVNLGHPGYSPGALPGPGNIPGGMGRPGIPPSGIAGPINPGSIGANGPMPHGPGGGNFPGGPAPRPGLNGLDALAKSDWFKGRPPTANMNKQALADIGDKVRNNFNFSDCFNGNWKDRYPGSWWVAGWTSPAYAYSTPSWSDYAGYAGYGGYGSSGSSRGYDAQPVYYDYGTNIVYQGDTVYVNGDAAGTHEQYAQQATTLADSGRQAPATQEEQWLPLGVFAMVQGEQVTGNDLFQLAVNKAGVIRGNYYNALSDTNQPVYGAVDQKTQRAAWTVGDRKEPVFEAGIANLTQPQTTMLVHFGKGRTQQWTLVRIEQSGKEK
jgi:hypothetical protein